MNLIKMVPLFDIQNKGIDRDDYRKIFDLTYELEIGKSNDTAVFYELEDCAPEHRLSQEQLEDEYEGGIWKQKSYELYDLLIKYIPKETLESGFWFYIWW